MSITAYTADGQNKLFKIDKFLRAAVTEWLGYPAVKFYTTENGEDETNTFSPDDVVFAIPYTPDKSLDRAIFKACKKGNFEEVKDLISRCADVNATNEHNDTPIHWGSAYGHDSVVDMLLKNGADVNASNEQTDTPLHWASIHGHDSVVDILLKNGADVNASNEPMDTPINLASIYGHDSVVEMLLKNGAIDDTRD